MPSQLLTSCMQVLSGTAATSDGPWLEAITEKAFQVYCERLKGFSWASKVGSVVP